MEGNCSNQPFLLLMQTSKEIHERIKEDIAKNNLSSTEFAVLEVLFRKGKQTIQQIAKSILISSGSMTYVVDKLEQKGLLERSACPDDRRAIHVLLTNEGFENMKKFMPTYEETVDKFFNILTNDEADTLVALLKKVRQFE